VRGWTHLERQKGGIGLRGPGETQLETDRRLIAKRIKHAARRLEKLARQRDTGRTCAARCRFRPWRWSATPTPASRRCSTR
jgi:GTPase